MVSLSIVLGFLAQFAITYASTAADASLSIATTGGKQSIFEAAIFLEANINRGDDGGLYAELIYNRAFQENGGTTTGWAGIGNTTLAIDTTTPLSWAIPRSVVPSVPAGSTSAAGLYNTGWFNQLPVIAGSTYTASFWARVASTTYTSGKTITVGLYSADLVTAYATATVDASKLTTGWNEFTVQLKPSASAPTAGNVFAIKLPSVTSGTVPRVSLTLISLFPPTFNNVKNGLRVDLAQALADLKPKYIRWPGGNDLEGATIDRRFNWTATLGPLRYRPGRLGTWNGYATGGLGLMEVFDWAESIGCKPLLGIYAGYSLDGTSIANSTALDPYIQDVLNEIHFMVDPAGSSTWATLRASYGRTAPYVLDTIEVGNEDNLGNGPLSYGYRFARFTQAITKEFPTHTFQYIATDSKTVSNAPSVDIHDYVVADTFINYYNRFDSWPRNNTKVYALEYAVLTGDYIYPNSTGLWDYGETNNRWSLPELRGSVAEFVYHLGFERNGDLVKGAAYAPIFHNTPLPRNELWLPDLISFNANTVARSTSYWVQWLIGNFPIKTILSVTTATKPKPLFWSAGTAADGSYVLKLANVQTGALSTGFTFHGAATGTYKATTYTLAPPTGLNNTAANPITSPNLVSPTTSTIAVTLSGSDLTGTVTVPGWSAVVVQIVHA